MKVYISSNTLARGGGGLRGNLQFLDNLLTEHLKVAGFTSSFENFTLTLCYPPLYILPETSLGKEYFLARYNAIPNSRTDRRFKRIDITLQAPEFSQHLNEDDADPQYKFDLSEPFHGATEVELAHILIGKFYEALALIKPKIRKDDSFDFAIFEKVLADLKNAISDDFLRSNVEKQTARFEEGWATAIASSRERRRQHQSPAETLIRDLRLYFTYKLPDALFYVGRISHIVLQKLVNKDFRCPHYHHLYISIGNSRDNALDQVMAYADWYTWGIAVLKEEDLLTASEEQRPQLVLDAIQEGLLDIADLDGLDKEKIISAIAEAREAGPLSERVLKVKKNKKIAFIISAKTIIGKKEEEIFFKVVDQESGRIAKWKFGEELSFLVEGWFRSITVTNKTIKTAPRANYDLVLENRPKHFKIDVIHALAGEGAASVTIDSDR